MMSVGDFNLPSWGRPTRTRKASESEFEIGTSSSSGSGIGQDTPCIVEQCSSEGERFELEPVVAQALGRTEFYIETEEQADGQILPDMKKSDGFNPPYFARLDAMRTKTESEQSKPIIRDSLTISEAKESKILRFAVEHAPPQTVLQDFGSVFQKYGQVLSLLSGKGQNKWTVAVKLEGKYAVDDVSDEFKFELEHKMLYGQKLLITIIGWESVGQAYKGVDMSAVRFLSFNPEAWARSDRAFFSQIKNVEEYKQRFNIQTPDSFVVVDTLAERKMELEEKMRQAEEKRRIQGEMQKQEEEERRRNKLQKNEQLRKMVLARQLKDPVNQTTNSLLGSRNQAEISPPPLRETQRLELAPTKINERNVDNQSDGSNLEASSSSTLSQSRQDTELETQAWLFKGVTTSGQKGAGVNRHESRSGAAIEWLDDVGQCICRGYCYFCRSKASIMFMPHCGHLAYCQECYYLYWKKNPPFLDKCPLCMKKKAHGRKDWCKANFIKNSHPFIAKENTIIKVVSAQQQQIRCFYCQSNFGNCMNGTCYGTGCSKQEMTMSNGQTRVIKGCVNTVQYTGCNNANPYGTQCICNDKEFCNGAFESFVSLTLLFLAVSIGIMVNKISY